jgi:hypothetical protein
MLLFFKYKFDGEVREMEEKFGYVIKVDGTVVWEGRNPKEKYFEIRKQNPGKEIAIAWRTKEKILVC